ncbi:undecaprenyl-diphosphate phosphatase [Candidatus Babeliales bacterium]|nr:undecaprenyl-diphosphate phosphatase [Candidatus Babeliales bacterium]
MIILFWILIQIIGESLPISSSGHVQLMLQYFQASFQNFENFDFLLHGPTIIILLSCFFTTWWKLIFKKKSLKNLFSSACFIIAADVITFFFWKLQLSKLPFIEHYFLPIGFFITIVCLYFSWYQKNEKKVSWSMYDAIILGIVQGLCLLPGISRFAGTYAAGIWLGYNRKNSVALSFLIQFPLLCAAFFKELCMTYYQPESLQNFVQSWMIAAVIFASLISYAIFCWVIKLIEQNRLWYFAFYMMVPMSLSLWMVKDVVT